MREKIKKFWEQRKQRRAAFDARWRAMEQEAKAAQQATQQEQECLGMTKPKRKFHFGFWRALWKDCKFVGQCLTKLLVSAILLQVAAYFVPDLPDKMPSMYALADLIIQFSECLAMLALTVLKSLTGISV